MPGPVSVEGVPPGLECLNMLVEIVEILSGFETKNKYSLKNANGRQLYYALEDSDCCERICCGPNRGFTLHIVDNFGRVRKSFGFDDHSDVVEQVIHDFCPPSLKTQWNVASPISACFGLCGNVSGCGSVCKIESPPGRVIGKVEQRGAFCASSFVIKDQDDQVIFQIDGPCCCLMCGCQDKEFPIDTPSGDPFGSITKEWGGCCKESFTDADRFCVSFPMSLDVKSKAVLLGAAFLVDFMEFEQAGHVLNEQQ
ncbi:Scramblase [Ancylostoma caninum]|uniref:Phospholipid scramblase n=1 Tax=Ancylostoma caninum TaxID=29170 RepID=A0A368G9K8_ANCCA|nr:Scramblase [Ancylostoma caninum]